MGLMGKKWGIGNRGLTPLSQKEMVPKTFRFPLSFPTSLFFRLLLERINKKIRTWN